MIEALIPMKLQTPKSKVWFTVLLITHETDRDYNVTDKNCATLVDITLGIAQKIEDIVF